MKEGYIYIANNIMPTLLAISQDEQSRGLMYMEWPPPIMSFIYASPGINKFWMKNTPSPLDIVFCNNNIITQICVGIPHSTQVIGGDNLSDLIIELPYGTVKSSGIKLGNEAGLIRPTVAELKKNIYKNAPGM